MPPPEKLPKLDTSSSPHTISFNGNLTHSPTIPISSADPGYLLGLGVFETISFRGGIPLCFSRHFRRLQNGAAVLGISTPTSEELWDAITKTAAANAVTEARIRITLTGDPLSGCHPNTLVTAQPLKIPEKPATAITIPTRRNPTSPLSGIKSTSYAESVLALRNAKSQGFDEAILCDTSGNLSEAASANLFFAKSGRLHTPPLSTGCLPGVTREIILELCEANGFPVSVKPMPPSALAGADEAFLTSSIRGIHPLASFDGASFPSPPGPVTRQIKGWLKSLIEQTPDP